MHLKMREGVYDKNCGGNGIEVNDEEFGKWQRVIGAWNAPYLLMGNQVSFCYS